MEGEYIFTDEEYITVCDLAQNGRNKQLKAFLSKSLNQRKVGIGTFSPTPTTVSRRLSPLTHASCGGKTDTVKFLLKQYGKYVQVNPGLENFKKDPLLEKEHRHDLPLYWACLNGHLDVVKTLVSAKASVNLPNCMMSSPLHAAASNGHVAIMEYLIAKHADVNAVDIFNFTPLMVAIQGGHLRVVDYLLQKRVDTSVTSKEGYTVMHLAALHGHHNTIRLLLDHGLPPLYKDASSSSDKDYVPCPLFLAAAKGHFEVACLLIDNIDSPPQVESDMNMLLGVGLHEMLHRCSVVQLPKRNSHFRIRSSKPEYPRDVIESCWINGVALRTEHNLQVHLPRVDSYGNESEMNSVEEVLATSQDITRNVYQTLLIMERCLGPGHPLIVESCINNGNSYLDMSLYKGVQRVLQNMITRWNMEMERSFYREPLSIHTTLESFLHRLVPWSRGASFYTMRDPPTRDYVRYMDLALCMLDVLMKVQRMHKCEGDSIQSILSALLYFLACWLQSTYQSSLYECLRTIDMYIGPNECEELGKRLVTNHLNSLEGTTLLHMTLNDSRLQKASRTKRYTWKNGIACAELEVDLGLLLYALLRWGADAAINVFDWNGQRPLHLAVVLTEEDRAKRSPTKHNIIKPLLRYGVHLGYLNKEGKMAADLCVTEATQALLKPTRPYPLTCLACIKVIQEGIDYEAAPDIPQRIKKLIRNHQGRP